MEGSFQTEKLMMILNVYNLPICWVIYDIVHHFTLGHVSQYREAQRSLKFSESRMIVFFFPITKRQP